MGKDDVAQDASISVENFTPIPKHGHLEFDFSGSNRPIPHHDIAISDRKMLHILVDKLSLIDKYNMEWANEFLEDCMYAERKTLAGQGYSYWHPDFARAKAVSRHIEYLYNNLALRKDQAIAAQRSEFVAVDIGQAPLSEEEEAKAAEELALEMVAAAEALKNDEAGSNMGDGDGSVMSGNQNNETSKQDDNDGVSVISFDTMGDPRVKSAPDQVNVTTGECSQPVSEGGLIVDPAGGAGGEEELQATIEEGGGDDKLHVDDGDEAKPVGYIRGDDDNDTHLDSFASEKRHDDHGNFINHGSHDTIADRLFLIQQHGKIATEALCVCIMEYCETFMSTRWMKSAQLALLVSCFTAGRLERTEFGSYRVEMVVLLYTRLLDIHNFEFVLMELTAREHACVVARIGALNLFNPWKPEGAYQLDLGRWEERQIAKILTHISVLEPGENWTRCEFATQRDLAPMPGWSLNVTWFTEEGFPSQGLLTVHQYSGEGLFRKACQADIDLRQKLLSLVLIDPAEIHLGEKQPIAVKPIGKWTIADANKRIKDFPSIKWTYQSDQSNIADDDVWDDDYS